MHIYFNYIQGSGSWSSSWHVKVASGLSAANESLTFFLSFLYLAFPLMLGGQGPTMAYCMKHVKCSISIKDRYACAMPTFVTEVIHFCTTL